MKASDKLLKLEGHHLTVFKSADEGQVAVCYEDAWVKDGLFLRGEFGHGVNFEEACEDYLNIISGKTLVFDVFDGKREEVRVL